MVKHSKKTKEQARMQRRRYRVRLKARVFKYYGGTRPKCECCGEREKTFLCIDHIQGGGQRERRESGYSDIYMYLLKQGFPPGYRLLCYNCNFAVQFGTCPHHRGK